MRRRRWLFILIPLLALGLLLALGGPRVLAHSGQDVPSQTGANQDRSPIDQRCLTCHVDSDAVVTFGDGSTRPVAFNLDGWDNSVHGLLDAQEPLSCYDCHGDYTFPHSGQWDTSRAMALDLNQQCERCHASESALQADSMHAQALAAGNENAPVCIDCHGYHDITSPQHPRSAISITCGNCHTEIFREYSQSVHGAALLTEGNQDVPTCVDCHGVHNIGNPTTNLFRLKSPEICAKCHADQALMDKYGISTDVFTTYVSDFHGTTVTLFEHEAPDAQVNKAVCYDCHGVHDILPPNDPRSSVMATNLLATCQKCHPDAQANFSSAWLSHYEPDPTHYPLVYYVNVFYKFFIPSILGFFAVVIIPDAGRRLYNRFGKKSKTEHAAPKPSAEEDQPNG